MDGDGGLAEYQGELLRPVARAGVKVALEFCVDGNSRRRRPRQDRTAGRGEFDQKRFSRARLSPLFAGGIREDRRNSKKVAGGCRCRRRRRLVLLAVIGGARGGGAGPEWLDPFGA